MPQRSPTRFIPWIVLAAFVIGLAGFHGPRVWQAYLFRAACREMLAAIEGGNLQGALPYILPSQRPRAEMFFQLLPSGYDQHIDSLELYRVIRADADTMEALVSCKVGSDEAAAPYQGRLFWHWQDGQWLWDFDSTLYSAWPTSGQPNWQELESAVAAATEAYN
jgi:hypothetical protein